MKDTGYFYDGLDFIGDRNNSNVLWSSGYHYLSPNFYFAVSKTTDLGSNWTRYDLSAATGYCYALVMDPNNSNIVYAGGFDNSAAAIYKTTNGGTNWTKLPVTGLAGWVYSLVIDPDMTTSMYAGTTNGIFKSTNSGDSWTNTGFTGGATNALIIHNLPVRGDEIYAGTNGNGVYLSTNAGATWTQVNDGLKSKRINCFGIDPGHYLYAASDGSSLYRTNIVVGIEEQSRNNASASRLLLRQNIMTGSLCMTYYLANPVRVTLSIYDIQGRLINTLVDGVKGTGNHSATWNGTDQKHKRVSPGIYVCRLVAGDQQQTEKVIKIAVD